MNDLIDQLEAERYELFEGPAYRFNFNRRQFLKAFSGGIALIVPMSNLVAHTLQQEQGESGRNRSNERVPDDIGAWIHIDENGMVSAYTGKVEIGQNIRDGQSKRFDNHQRSIVKSDQCSSRVDEVTQGIQAGIADTAGELSGDGSRSISVLDNPRC